jgi:hypothetical protein
MRDLDCFFFLNTVQYRSRYFLDLAVISAVSFSMM